MTLWFHFPWFSKGANEEKLFDYSLSTFSNTCIWNVCKVYFFLSFFFTFPILYIYFFFAYHRSIKSNEKKMKNQTFRFKHFAKPTTKSKKKKNKNNHRKKERSGFYLPHHFISFQFISFSFYYTFVSLFFFFFCDMIENRCRSWIMINCWLL